MFSTFQTTMFRSPRFLKVGISAGQKFVGPSARVSGGSS